MIGHTEALAQRDDNAMDLDDEIISVDVLESLGLNTGDGTSLLIFFIKKKKRYSFAVVVVK